MFFQSIKMTKTLLACAAALSGSLLTSMAQAQSTAGGHEGWYQVELIVFARKDASEEHWPSNIQLRYPNDWVTLKDSREETEQEVDLNRQPFYRLPSSERKLNAQAQKLERNSRFQVLFHEAWRQVITNEKSAKSILIQGGQTFGQHQELEGSIRLSVATYLKLTTNLWYSQFDMNVGQEQTRQWPLLPQHPTQLHTAPLAGLSLDSSFEFEQALANENQQWLGTSTEPSDNNQPGTPDYLTRQIILLQQSRDMRSTEIHYIDHPVVGMVIQVSPYSAPTGQ